MNSDEIWLLQLWSGAFGACLGAGGAAAVAMLVLRKTNEHQTVLAAEAMDTQRAIAAEALKEQREHAKTALDQQRAALGQQLHEQRAEASLAREIAAIADLIPAIGDLTLEAMYQADESKLAPLVGRIQSAAARWWMELDAGP